MINKIHDIVLNDPKLEVLCARLVPRLLTIDQKCIRVTTPEPNLTYFNRNPKEILDCLVTMDETWIHDYTLELELAQKVMASVFWDAYGVIFINYFEKGRTITRANYAALLDRLVHEIRRNGHIWRRKKILFHNDNAPSAQAKKHELGFKSLPHPPYSPGLAPSVYYLFPNLKRWLCRRRFESNEEVEWETEGYFGEFDKSYYLEDTEKLKDRWTCCIELKGE